MRRRPGHQFGGVAGEQFYVADVMGLDLGQDFGHAVDIGLAADEAGIGKSTRLRDQMFAAAKSDLEPDLAGRRVEQAGETGRARSVDVERQPRQQMFDQVGLARAQSVALAPSEKRTVRVNGGVIVGRCVAIAVVILGVIFGIAGRDAHRRV